MPKEFDSEKIFDLGKSRDEEFGSTESDDKKVFFPGMSLDMDMIPGEVGKKRFVKMLIRKIGSNIDSGREEFEMQNMRDLGPGDEDEKEDELTPGEGFDKAVEIVMEKKIKIEPEED